MGAESKIEWTDHTFNPWIGCTKVAPGCTHCYAESYAKRYGKAEWGPSGTRVKTSDSYWRQPLKWNREAEAAGVRKRVFCASLADVFEDWDGPINGGGRDDDVLAIDDQRSRLLTMDDVRRELFSLIDNTPHLDWLLLTKRPDNIRRMWAPVITLRTGKTIEIPLDGPRQNVWLLTSISEQESADRNIPELLKCSDLAPVLGVSAEPLLGPIELRHGWTTFDTEVCPACGDIECNCGTLDWVIVGGESGHGARPFNLAWARSLRDQCASDGVPCFIKQLGTVTVDSDLAELDGTPGIVLGMKDKKGGNWDEWPADLRVREFPQTEGANQR